MSKVFAVAAIVCMAGFGVGVIIDAAFVSCTPPSPQANFCLVDQASPVFKALLPIQGTFIFGFLGSVILTSVFGVKEWLSSS